MIDVLDAFPAICCGALFLLFVVSVIAFCFGIARGEKLAEKRFAVWRESIEQHNAEAVLAAFIDGKEQGIREATPKHDPETGRFTKHAVEQG